MTERPELLGILNTLGVSNIRAAKKVNLAQLMAEVSAV